MVVLCGVSVKTIQKESVDMTEWLLSLLGFDVSLVLPLWIMMLKDEERRVKSA